MLGCEIWRAVRTSLWNCASRDGIRADRVGQELQRDRLAEAKIVGAVNLAHAALAEEADDAEPSVEHRTGREAAVIDRVGRAEPAARRRPGLAIGV